MLEEIIPDIRTADKLLAAPPQCISPNRTRCQSSLAIRHLIPTTSCFRSGPAARFSSRLAGGARRLAIGHVSWKEVQLFSKEHFFVSAACLSSSASALRQRCGQENVLREQLDLIQETWPIAGLRAPPQACSKTAAAGPDRETNSSWGIKWPDPLAQLWQRVRFGEGTAAVARATYPQYGCRV